MWGLTGKGGEMNRKGLGKARPGLRQGRRQKGKRMKGYFQRKHSQKKKRGGGTGRGVFGVGGGGVEKNTRRINLMGRNSR